MNAKKLKELGQHLFGKKGSLNSLWQEIADNFYPERAIFTINRSLGADFASNLLSSYPVLCRRDLGNLFGSMLRPSTKPWFHVTVRDEEVDNETQRWLDAFERAQWRAMYDPRALFSKATKEGDHDFAAFGQCAISVELNREGDGLLYRCWHLKDMAWEENENGAIGCVFRKWKAPALTLQRTFTKEKVHTDINKAVAKEPFKTFNFMHMVVEAELYDEPAGGKPYWHLWYDCDHDEVVHATPAWTRYYVIPRWQTVSGTQYSYSPATVAALPDGRLLQAMTWTLLEAGERATWPPMIATVDAVRSDVGNFAGGITWVDPEYDERRGDALRPLSQDFRGVGFGMELNTKAEAMLYRAFYLDTLSMPQKGPEMTAYEVSQRIQQYIRDALPIFEPLEMDYNAGLCEMTFDLLWRNGAFGSPLEWPQTLSGAEISFMFESPLHDAVEEIKAQKLLETSQLTAAVLQYDPSVAKVPDFKEALRGALDGIGVDAKWLRNREEVEQMEDAEAQERELEKMLAVAKDAGSAAKDLGEAQVASEEAGAFVR